jgi:hypothetical protein
MIGYLEVFAGLERTGTLLIVFAAGASDGVFAAWNDAEGSCLVLGLFVSLTQRKNLSKFFLVDQTRPRLLEKQSRGLSVTGFRNRL